MGWERKDEKRKEIRGRGGKKFKVVKEEELQEI